MLAKELKFMLLDLFYKIFYRETKKVNLPTEEVQVLNDNIQ